MKCLQAGRYSLYASYPRPLGVFETSFFKGDRSRQDASGEEGSVFETGWRDNDKELRNSRSSVP